jgi:alpha,alpha-trehalase
MNPSLSSQASLHASIELSTLQIAAIRAYIKKTWATLTRSHEHLLEAARDPKLKHDANQPWLIYISAQEDRQTIIAVLSQTLRSQELRQIEIRTLPAEVDHIQEHGLLYLPGPYVVPGGRFNELFGWDSYFIQLGLLRDGEIELAKSLVEQLLYQVQHYGTVLNANRTYFLTRSQPPFLSQMVLAQFQHTQDRAWLQRALPTVEQFYYYWTLPPHLNQATGLSRYFALGEGPAPEVLFSERNQQGRNHYDSVLDYYRQFEVTDYDIHLYYDPDSHQLTDLFYKGDRSMRESGFDITNRFGPFSVDIIHYAPVCLNSLLYQMELDLAQINEELGNETQAQPWRDRAIQRRQTINQLLWDETAGLYLDYNFRTNQRNHYEFATAFYPLWVGLASIEQAQRIVEEHLPHFEAPGGLLTSTRVTGCQWDAPFGWAPLNLIAEQGLRRYGYHQDATRLAHKFLKLVIQEFEKQGTIVEKYDVNQCSANVSDEIFFGYSSNEIGFGWTNGVVLEMLANLGI